MNGKKAKRLRKQAEQETTGQSRVEYRLRKGMTLKERFFYQLILAPDCTRARHKKLKRAVA